MCGDCITFVCRECSPKVVPRLVITCPEHGQQNGTTSGIMDIALACGCVFKPVSIEGGWVREDKANKPT